MAVGGPLAEQLGGGRTAVEKIAAALKGALGQGGSGPGGDMEDAWRQAKALGLARAIALEELAFYQAFPARASVHLPVYEAILAIPTETTIAARQRAVLAAWRKLIDASVPGLRADLQAIDPNIDISNKPHSKAIVARYGRPFSSLSGTVPDFVAYSTDDVLTVVWSGLEPLDGIPPSDKRERVEKLLAQLPAWIDWRLVNGTRFYLDGAGGSRLDLTALGE